MEDLFNTPINFDKNKIKITLQKKALSKRQNHKNPGSCVMALLAFQFCPRVYGR